MGCPFAEIGEITAFDRWSLTWGGMTAMLDRADVFLPEGFVVVIWWIAWIVAAIC